MADLAFLTLAGAFFVICVAYVRALDRMVRAAEDADSAHAEAETTHRAAA